MTRAFHQEYPDAAPASNDALCENIAQLSPYITEHIARFGVYATDVLRLLPKAFDPELADVDFDSLQEAA